MWGVLKLLWGFQILFLKKPQVISSIESTTPEPMLSGLPPDSLNTIMSSHLFINQQFFRFLIPLLSFLWILSLSQEKHAWCQGHSLTVTQVCQHTQPGHRNTLHLSKCLDPKPCLASSMESRLELYLNIYSFFTLSLSFIHLTTVMFCSITEPLHSLLQRVSILSH